MTQRGLHLAWGNAIRARAGSSSVSVKVDGGGGSYDEERGSSEEIVGGLRFGQPSSRFRPDKLCPFEEIVKDLMEGSESAKLNPQPGRGMGKHCATGQDRSLWFVRELFARSVMEQREWTFRTQSRVL